MIPLTNWLQKKYNLTPCCSFPLEEHSIIAELNEKQAKEIESHLGIPIITQNNQEKIAYLPSLLGLHIEDKTRNKLNLKVSYFIGCSWIRTKRERILLKVIPKKGGIKHLEKMLMVIWKDSEVKEFFLKNLDKILWFSFDDEPIPVEENESESLVLFSTLTFLHLVDLIVKKGLKSSFIRKNYYGLPKGKILIKETWDKFHSKGYILKVASRKFELSKDCPENRILKFVLLKLSEELTVSPLLKDKILYLLSFFRDVFSVPKINRKDFSYLVPSPFFKEYSIAIKLALLILEGLGVSTSPSTLSYKRTITPHALNMPMLYELYVWSKYKEKYQIEKLYYQKHFKTNLGNFRPDFIIKFKDTSCAILEVKYKFNPSNQTINRDRKQINNYEDLRRIRDFLEEIGCKHCKKILVYPSLQKNRLEELNKEFVNTSIEVIQIDD